MAAHSVFVTGADKGLGLCLARRFVQDGFRVFAGRYDERADAGAPSDLLVQVPLDVSDTASIREAAARVAQETQALDILVNNAGIHLDDFSPIEETDLDDGHLERTFAVNAFGPLRVTQRFLPLLERGQNKTIVNVSSEAGSITDCGREAEHAYCMSKAALNMLTRIFHNRLAPRGYRVVAVHPGWMRTDMGGPRASITPEEAAEGIFTIATGTASGRDSAIFLDHLGKPMRW
jgi:NAD(P)-dependent dehydrogenase (short-subunit alcohol dehydrogenase family)